MKLIKLFIYSNLTLIGLCSCSRPVFKLHSSKMNPRVDAIAYSTDSTPYETIITNNRFFKKSLNKESFEVLNKQKISSYYNVTKPYPITAKELDKTLQGKLRNKGQDIINISKKYKICPLFLAAICCHESGNGSSVYAKKYNNVSGQMKRDKSSGKWGPLKFAFVNECLNRTASNLKENYIDGGRVTISKIQAKYCPIITNKKSKDYNDSRGVNKYWESGIQKWMTRIQSNKQS